MGRKRERKYGNMLSIGKSGVGYMKIHSAFCRLEIFQIIRKRKIKQKIRILKLSVCFQLI